MFCRKCGTNMKESDMFCPKCGTKTSAGNDKKDSIKKDQFSNISSGAGKGINFNHDKKENDGLNISINKVNTPKNDSSKSLIEDIKNSKEEETKIEGIKIDHPIANLGDDEPEDKYIINTMDEKKDVTDLIKINNENSGKLRENMSIVPEQNNNKFINANPNEKPKGSGLLIALIIMSGLQLALIIAILVLVALYIV